MTRRPAVLLAVTGTLAVSGTALAVLAGLTRPKRVVVNGVSMLPTLAPGDRLLIARKPRILPGDVVALRDPRDDGHLIVKRVASVQGDTLMVKGDNRAASTDSREFGPVSRADVVGSVVRRYGPRDRKGPVR